MRYHLVSLALILILTACSGAEEIPRGERAGGGLETFGALRAMLHEGAVDEVVNLAALLPDSSLYAVGALSELRGEVTVIAGQAYYSYPDGEVGQRSVTPEDPAEGAALLVISRVKAWRPVKLERAVSFANLDLVIGNLAARAGLPADLPFPFLIQGEVEDLRWHVIDGSKLQGGGSSHEEHMATAVKGSLPRTEALLIGFHSTAHHGVFTHMGSSTHIHCIVEEPFVAGHVDHVILPAGTIVGIPVE
jgi:hypothetical protein